MLANVQARISLLRAVTLAHPQRGQDMVTELRAVLDAIDARDGGSAFVYSVAHVMAASRIALDHLAREAAPR
jgi:DNA-binding GntR family transcriptional regulator